MAEEHAPAKKPDPYRWYMPPYMWWQAILFFVAFFGVLATVVSRFVRDWPLVLQLAALALALTLLLAIIRRSRHRSRNTE